MPFLNRRNLAHTTKRHDATPRRVDRVLIENILASLAAGLPEQDRRSLTQAGYVATLETHWQDIVGPVMASHSRPTHISNDTLLIACDHSIFSAQIQMMKTKILAAAQEKSGNPLKKIRTFIQPNIWQNTVIDRRKTGDIISPPSKVVVQENTEELEKKKILEALEQEFSRKSSELK